MRNELKLQKNRKKNWCISKRQSGLDRQIFCLSFFLQHSLWEDIIKYDAEGKEKKHHSCVIEEWQ